MSIRTSSLWDGGSSGHQRQKLAASIMRRDCGLCQPCRRHGLVTIATQVDHIKPRANGGTDDDTNLQAICEPCHELKTAEDEGRTHVKREGVGVDGIPKGWQ